MKKGIFVSAACICAAVVTGLSGVSCGHRGGGRTMSGETDSLSYVIGMNVGLNLLQIDSTLNVEMVCSAIRDVFGGRSQMTAEQGRDYFLRQMNYASYERFRRYEEQFLSDLSKSNRAYVRTKTGVTYRVTESGNQQQLAAGRDTLLLHYRLSTRDGLLSDAGDTVRVSLSSMVPGLQEVLKLVGRGGRFDAWIPSDQAYGRDGDAETGVGPNATLFYEVDVVDIVPYSRK